MPRADGEAEPGPCGTTILGVLEYVMRWVLFLAYLCISIYLMDLLRSRRECFVQHTYRQEFAVDMVSNPMFTSANLMKTVPATQLERNHSSMATPYQQNVKSIFAFPTVIKGSISSSAFLTIFFEPSPIVAAMTVTPMSMQMNQSYYWSTTRGVYGFGVPWKPEEQQPILDFMLESTSRDKRYALPGTQLPNIGRCLDVLAGTEDMEARKKEMRLLHNNSHRLGACLLTGQHASVDLTSNYATSMILFSSVNAIFMVGMVIWISASFALFHIGGYIKTSKEMEGGGEGTDTSCCTLDDWLIAVAILWNAVMLLLLLSQDFRMYQNIPLNNAILAVAALLVSILVQWGWANSHTFDVALQEAVSGTVIGRQYSSEPPAASKPKALGTPPNAGAASIIHSFDTSNFMATASAVRDYGVQYANAAILNNGSHNQNSSLRKRNWSSGSGSSLAHNNTSDASDREFGSQSFYAVPFGQNARRMNVMQSSMPSYTQLIRLGTPFAQYNYINIMKKEMFMDSMHGIEYAITTPMLFATILAAMSPTVPTGIVQWAFGCLTASHLLVVPLMYMSHLFSEYSSKDKVKTGSLLASIIFTMFACAILQLVGLYIFMSYTLEVQNLYQNPHGVSGIAIGIMITQLLFVLMAVLFVILQLVGCGTDSNFTYYTWLYILCNTVMKLGLGCMMAMHAETKHFPVLTCKIWDSHYAN